MAGLENNGDSRISANDPNATSMHRSWIEEYLQRSHVPVTEKVPRLAESAAAAPREIEASREDQNNKFNDSYRRDAKNRVGEYKYSGAAQSFKVNRNDSNEVDFIKAPDGSEYTKYPTGWGVKAPGSESVSFVQLGNVTLDETGLHTDNADGVKALGLPDDGRAPLRESLPEEERRAVDAHTLHTKFQAIYTGDQLENIEIRQGNNMVGMIARSSDGYYLTRPSGETVKVSDVKFDEKTCTVSYRDAAGQEQILQKGDTTYIGGQPAITAKSISFPPIR